MRKTKLVLAERIEQEIPQLSFVACYEADDERLLANMRMYRNRAFVYLLAIDVGDREEVVYVGQSMFQYGRMMQHMAKYFFSRVYLFACEESELKKCEAQTIRMLMPLFNRHHNPNACQYQRVLNIDYDDVQDEETMFGYFQSMKEYRNWGLYGFALPPVLYSLLKADAVQHNRTVSEEMLDMLEAVYADDIYTALESGMETQRTNLRTTSSYGELHSRSEEQIKQYLHQDGRLVGEKVGRDWILIEDAVFPKDRRERTTMY